MAVVLVSAGALAGSSLPAGATTLINFDNLSNGTVLNSQYAAEGVTFGVAAPGNGDAWPLYVNAEPGAYSPPNDVRLRCGEVCATGMWADFSAPEQQVSVYVGNFGAPTSASVIAYDGSGNEVASAPITAGTNQWQQVTVTDPADSILYVVVQNPNVAFAMDNLSFSGASQPDFALIPGFDTTNGIGAPVGGTTSVPFTLRRFGGSAGKITFSNSSLPAGVTLSLSPDPDFYGDNTPVTGTITVSPGTKPVSSYPVTITAKPVATAGTAPQTVSFPLTIQSTYQLRVQGIEVTQGVQDTALPVRNLGNLAAPVTYNGVNLVDLKPTAVRVFADAPGAPAGGVLGVTAQLTGFQANGHQLPGTLDAAAIQSPNEDGTGGLVDSHSATVPASERDSTTGSFEFLLPNSWENFANTLKVTLIPPSGPFDGPAPAAVPCTTAACKTLASMTLTGITYTNTGDVDLGVVTLLNDGAPPEIDQPLGDWTRLIPASNIDTFGIVGANDGSIDIGWALAGCPDPAFGDVCPSRSDKNSVVLNALQDYVGNDIGPNQYAGYLGVTDQDLGIESGSLLLFDKFGTQFARPAEAIVDGDRPVTDVDHEIGHMLGLVHASYDCGAGANGNTAESWPPDQHGYIDSIGLDITGAPPFAVVAGPGGPQRPAADCTGSTPANPPACGGTNPQQYFDFMSYCTWNDPNSDGTLGSTNAWVSAANWERMVADLAAQVATGIAGRADGPGAALPHSQKTTPDVMRVFGFSDPQDGTHLTLVDPTPSTAPVIGSASGFTVAAVSSAGKTTASAPLYGQASHVDGVGGLEVLDGTLPLSEGTTAAELEVTKGGKVVATLSRPATKPTVTLGKSLPVSGCATGGIDATWTAADRATAKPHLSAAVDFSANGGSTWTEVYDGPAVKSGESGSDAVTLPRTLLKASEDAQVRVRVSDGYNQVTATSAKFCVAAAAPTATITAPAADQLAPGAPVALSGTGYDDNGASLTGTALTWRAYGPGLAAAGVTLGTGSPLVATLPAATTKITLTAVSGGRSAIATEQVATPVTPLKLENGWTGGPFGTAQPAATLVSGVVHFQGAMATSGTNPVAFTLPPALRPASNVYVPVDLCNAANGRLLIQPSGQVSVQAEGAFSGAQCFTSLDGASYVLQATTSLVPLNGWTGGPFGTAQPAATLMSGVVHLRGAISGGGSTSSWVFTLPPALRPTTDVYVPVDLCNATNGRLLITPQGEVIVQAEDVASDAQCFTSLDGASFALTASTPLTTVNGWRGAPFETSDPAVTLVSGVVQLKGAIATTGSIGEAFTLPAGLRPAKDVYVQADLCNAANGRLLIQPNGEVTVQPEGSFSDAQCFTSLDGISFVP
jgi:hypothetical protein